LAKVMPDLPALFRVNRTFSAQGRFVTWVTYLHIGIGPYQGVLTGPNHHELNHGVN
jgi:hypothetical protein